MSKLAPIVLFVYNRPSHTQKCLENLMGNDLADESTLYIYADGTKENSSKEELERIKDVRELIRKKKWCGTVEIIERKKNIGIGNSIIEGIGEIVNKYGKVIVLEDDLVTSSGFLRFMNEALSLYENCEQVMHVSGYMHPVKRKMPETFFHYSTSIWGWGTYARAWNYFNCDSNLLLNRLLSSSSASQFTLGNVDYLITLLQNNALLEQQGKSIEDTRKEPEWNWDICWYASVFSHKGFCLSPRLSLVRNVGYDNSGVHCKNVWWSKIYKNQKLAKNIRVNRIELIECKEAKDAIVDFYLSLNNPGFLIRAKEKTKLILKNKFFLNKNNLRKA